MKKKLIILLMMLSSLAFGQNAHFWDGIEDFDGPTDDNPVMAAQIDFYFDKMVAPLPDSINLEINRLIERTGGNTELRDFILWHLLGKYQRPEFMDQEQVFVFLYDQYFSQLDIKDLSDLNRPLIEAKAERLRKLALHKTAPNFQVNDTVDLQSIEGKYTVLFFYDHDCELCQQERQDLDSVVAAHPEITLLALDMNTDDENYIVLYGLYDIETTPLIYVLDEDKRIIGKKIQAKQIPQVL